MFEVNGTQYSESEILDSIQDGVCDFCGETTPGHEPDAETNWCSCCGNNTVRSIQQILLFS
jgi:hypothetical protein